MLHNAVLQSLFLRASYLPKTGSKSNVCLSERSSNLINVKAFAPLD